MTNKNNMNMWRQQVITRSKTYADHLWTPSQNNVFRGYDINGIYVNTPDSAYESAQFDCGWWQVNQTNKGIPYNWGGCSTIEDFDIGIMNGKPGGNVPDSRDNGVSYDCVGVDCSGLVSICWGLEKRVSTKTMLNVATPLESMGLMKPGDILLQEGSHVMIFIAFTDDMKSHAIIIDASKRTGKVLERIIDIAKLTEQGYIACRLKSDYMNLTT